jgi:hypothetical protein
LRNWSKPGPLVANSLNSVKVNIFDFGADAVAGDLDFLGIKSQYILKFAPVGQTQVHALVAHAGLRQSEQPSRPSFFEFDAHGG